PHPCLYVVDDCVGVFGSRVVASNYSAIRAAFGDLAHQRPLPLVPVSAAAENNYQLAASEGAGSLQAPLERIGGMRVISQYRWTRRDDLQPARDLRDIAESFSDDVR